MEAELERDDWWRRKTELRIKHGGVDVLKESPATSISSLRLDDEIAHARVVALRNLRAQNIQHQLQQQRETPQMLRLDNDDVIMVRVVSDNAQFTLPSPEFFGSGK